MSDTYSYHPELPEDCPLDGAMPVDSIYRSVANFPPTAADFLSDVEANRAGRQALQLQALGCSVWETVEAASHARKIYDHFRTSYIVVGDLDPSDGQVLATPSKKQPEHATSWGPGGVSASPRRTRSTPSANVAV